MSVKEIRNMTGNELEINYKFNKITLGEVLTKVIKIAIEETMDTCREEELMELRQIVYNKDK